VTCAAGSGGSETVVSVLVQILFINTTVYYIGVLLIKRSVPGMANVRWAGEALPFNLVMSWLWP